MLRYRIAEYCRGHRVVLSAWTEVVPLEETYATRVAAQEMADWLNSLDALEGHQSGQKPGRDLAAVGE